MARALQHDTYGQQSALHRGVPACASRQANVPAQLRSRTISVSSRSWRGWLTADICLLAVHRHLPSARVVPTALKVFGLAFMQGSGLWNVRSRRGTRRHFRHSGVPYDAWPPSGNAGLASHVHTASKRLQPRWASPWRRNMSRCVYTTFNAIMHFRQRAAEPDVFHLLETERLLR